MSLFDLSAIDRVKAEPDFFADVAHMPELGMAVDSVNGAGGQRGNGLRLTHNDV